MAFADFDLKTARDRLGLSTDENRDLFSSVPGVEVPAWLSHLLDMWVPAALPMNTEKARSELIIAPILMAAVGLAPQPVRLFSGMTFDVDKDQGLNGACDFLLTRSEERYFISHPVVAIVEAKKDDYLPGLGQCVASMVAARIFNEREGNGCGPVYGVLTSGTLWRFLKLDNTKAYIDRSEYHLHQLDRILGILIFSASPVPVPAV